jgi:hypothetical protein
MTEKRVTYGCVMSGRPVKLDVVGKARLEKTIDPTAKSASPHT